ncbi:Cyanovirin-N [Aspergillus uvarum CBS 121591]|uniref:Cyanovirin-N n=1 Tax=Aspergillus uvarum CBS 121591 TaxID=1448315 RepID=A0A319DF83_9EURO|nr:Cyanovirin-N [Aspergillus uvarum CBS 121591]PYH86688.1 Cyanovirin-N [Aspergillus uvarum CBS 121591]
MSFHSSSQDIHIVHEDGSTMLCCVARDRHGEFHPRKIRLDQHIGNTDGWFIWGGQNFTETASDVRLEMTEYGPKLVANLRTHDGGSRGLQGIMLSDKIANEDGRLRFLGP